jgi:hypothetical protein
MFGNKERVHTTTSTLDRAPIARGGVAFGPIFTGVVVALGAMFLLSAIVGGVVAGLGVTDAIDRGQVVEATLGAGIVLVVAQFLSYLWGGYTAGRMGRGAGFANGALVPVVAILLAIAVGAVATALGAEANLNLPFTTNRLPLDNDLLVDWGVAVGIASLVAMFLGGILGGLLGARWHTKLERRVGAEHQSEIEHTHLEPDRGSTPVGTSAAHQAPLAPDAHRTEPEGIDIRDQSADTGAIRNEDGTYTQRSSAETQTFRS